MSHRHWFVHRPSFVFVMRLIFWWLNHVKPNVILTVNPNLLSFLRSSTWWFWASKWTLEDPNGAGTSKGGVVLRYAQATWVHNDTYVYFNTYLNTFIYCTYTMSLRCIWVDTLGFALIICGRPQPYHTSNAKKKTSWSVCGKFSRLVHPS